MCAVPEESSRVDISTSLYIWTIGFAPLNSVVGVVVADVTRVSLWTWMKVTPPARRLFLFSAVRASKQRRELFYVYVFCERASDVCLGISVRV